MATYSDTRSGVSPLAILFVLTVAGLLMATLRTPAGKVKTTTHAVKRHGAEAEAIRNCIEQSGPDQIWQDDERDDIQYWCVELDPPDCGVIGTMIVQVWPSLVEGCSWRERSSFVARNGAPDRVRAFLEKIATRIK